MRWMTMTSPRRFPRRAVPRVDPETGEVTIPVGEYHQLRHESMQWRMSSLACVQGAEGDVCRDALSWRALMSSPHIEDLLGEWVEWESRRELSEATAEMAAMVDWRLESSMPSYAELERRRSVFVAPALTPAEIRAKAAASWADVDSVAA